MAMLSRFTKRGHQRPTQRAHTVSMAGAEPLFGARAGEASQFLPLALKRELSRFGWRVAALALTAVAVLFSVALASYNSLDPSLNTATTASPTNWLGRPGAFFADLLSQGFGMAAWFVIALLVAWAFGIWRTFSAPQPLRRLGWAFVAVAGVSLALVLILPGNSMAGGVFGFVSVSLLPGVLVKILALPLSVFVAVWATGRALCFSLKNVRLAFLGSAQTILTARQAHLERRRDREESPSILARFKSFFARTGAQSDDPAQSRAIPTFLQSGPVAQSPLDGPELNPIPRAEIQEDEVAADKSIELSDEVVAEEHVKPAAFSVSDEEAIYEAEEPAFLSPAAADDGFEPVLSEEEEIELITQRPATKLVETAQVVQRAAPAAPAKAKPKTAAAATASYDPPPLDLLYEPTQEDRAAATTQEEADAMARRLEETLRDYGVKGEIVRVLPGPVVTLYELEPAPGTKTSRVVGLADDIARSMAALSARIAPVPGKSVIGIELPNPSRETVFLHEMLQDAKFTQTKANLPLALGKDIGGQAVMADLAKMPHLLVAGTTGSGKSVAVNTMILSLVYALSPEQVRFIMIDPKILELSVYDGIPHLLSPVVTDPKKAVVALKWVVQEMNQRYQSMSTLNVRNIANFNTKIKNALADGETLTRQVQVGFCPESGEPIMEEQAFDMRPLPHIVVVVDEMAELMLMVGKDIEAAIQSIAQKARAAGIHMIMATQRPSVDVITGTIKANFPTRISFAVSSKIDSRTVLNEMGAEQLLGQGDMLYQPNGGRTMRVHGPFATDDEVEAVVEHLKETGTPDYIEAIVNEDVLEAEAGPDGLDLPLFEKESSGDDLYDRAVQVVLKDKKASTSHVQRRLQIGYNRAANLIDKMEDEGLITPADHVGRRKILIPGDSAID